ncbi:hypothetical protein AHMF7616_02064 [Adhaeribacter pallidiroseus]|uniref:Uncharacterized protein n=1 Tax=Adhaeribacter pallidiroseus TaxID=2072847 RepID=A0A369QGQ1_9BACT|nr:hypothetical protein AHMF7616_02064 [Adhaeribacter pallidiroseus]
MRTLYRPRAGDIFKFLGNNRTLELSLGANTMVIVLIFNIVRYFLNKNSLLKPLLIMDYINNIFALFQYININSIPFI